MLSAAIKKMDLVYSRFITSKEMENGIKNTKEELIESIFRHNLQRIVTSSKE